MARPIRDVGSAGRRESVAGARNGCGFGEPRQLALVKDSSVPRNGSNKRFGRIADVRSRREYAVRPGKGVPNRGTHLLTVCTTPGQLDDCVVLTLQQDGEQAALGERKGRG